MFDARLRPLINPPLNAAGRWLAARGFTANGVTLFGVILAFGALGALAAQHYGWALALVIANRLCDGIDGAIARERGPSDFGGYLDIVADFIFYTAIPLGFVFANPADALPAALLLAAFTLTGISFLAFATLAAKRGLDSEAHGKKSFFYSTGLAEGGETIAVFILMCLLPGAFAVIAFGYAALCAATVIQRSWLAWTIFRQ